MYFKIPPTLLDKWLPLPYVSQTDVHAKEPWTLGVHRMLGFADQQPCRSVCFTKGADGRLSAEMRDGSECVLRPDLPQAQLLAAASFMQGNVVTDALRRIKTFDSDAAAVLKGVISDAQDKLLNHMNGFRHDPKPWAGVGILPCAPDGEEFILARKDHLHPCAWYCNRLSFIGGSMDPHEVLGDWGGETGSSYVAMLRECFEEIRDMTIAGEIAAAVRSYHGPQHSRCHLSDAHGQASDGYIRLFVSRAPDVATWQRWREAFTGPDDILGEAHVAVVPRETLELGLLGDAAAAAARDAYLRDTPAQAVSVAQMEELRLFSRKHVVGGPDRWLANREAAQAAGDFPLKSRGSFAFIAGIAEPIFRVLRQEGLLRMLA